MIQPIFKNILLIIFSNDYVKDKITYDMLKMQYYHFFKTEYAIIKEVHCWTFSLDLEDLVTNI